MAIMCKQSRLQLVNVRTMPGSAMVIASSAADGTKRFFPVSEDRRARRKQAEEELNRKEGKSNKIRNRSVMEAAIKIPHSSTMAIASTADHTKKFFPVTEERRARRDQAEEELNRKEGKSNKIRNSSVMQAAIKTPHSSALAIASTADDTKKFFPTSEERRDRRKQAEEELNRKEGKSIKIRNSSVMEGAIKIRHSSAMTMPSTADGIKKFFPVNEERRARRRQAEEELNRKEGKSIKIRNSSVMEGAIKIRHSSAMTMPSTADGIKKFFPVSEERRARRKQAEEELNRKEGMSNKIRNSSVMQGAIRIRHSSAMAIASTADGTNKCSFLEYQVSEERKAKRKQAEEELNLRGDKRIKIQSVAEDFKLSKTLAPLSLPLVKSNTDSDHASIEGTNNKGQRGVQIDGLPNQINAVNPTVEEGFLVGGISKCQREDDGNFYISLHENLFSDQIYDFNLDSDSPEDLLVGSVCAMESQVLANDQEINIVSDEFNHFENDSWINALL
ncbi:Uncharacterized protein TCM_000211 [Theobroma cacao]|uniref:Uncharacterized protein n=1 Tax=Theobroma cacao TaxID=3641 RepID=A0A061DFR7_THECC|nr:Uncharacterized protein TCM_000211 [Theobroma cacao]